MSDNGSGPEAHDDEGRLHLIGPESVVVRTFQLDVDFGDGGSRDIGDEREDDGDEDEETGTMVRSRGADEEVVVKLTSEAREDGYGQNEKVIEKAIVQRQPVKGRAHNLSMSAHDGYHFDS